MLSACHLHVFYYYVKCKCTWYMHTISTYKYKLYIHTTHTKYKVCLDKSSMVHQKPSSDVEGSLMLHITSCSPGRPQEEDCQKLLYAVQAGWWLLSHGAGYVWVTLDGRGKKDGKGISESSEARMARMSANSLVWFPCLIYLINGLVQGKIGRNGFKQTWCYI